MFAVSESTWVWDVLGLLAVPALVVLNGLFVAAEFALVAVRRTRIEELVAQGVAGARAVQTGHPTTSTAPSPPPSSASPWRASAWAGSASRPWPGCSLPLFESLARRLAARRRPLRGHGHRVPAHHLPARRLRRADAQDAGPAAARPHRPVAGPARWWSSRG